MKPWPIKVRNGDGKERRRGRKERNGLALYFFSPQMRSKKVKRLMKPEFVQSPIEVRSELETLGLCNEGLLLAVDAAVLGRNNCTPNDVPSARGMRAWMEGTRALRDFYSPKGWEKCDDCIPSLFSREQQIKVIFVNTDDATGRNIEDRHPQNRSRRGPATDSAVSSNCVQLSMFSLFEEAENFVRIVPAQGTIQHWFLCVFHQKDTVRAELSFPESFEGGYFSKFRKRIVLLGEDGNGESEVVRHDDAPDGDYEISVTRKEA